MDNEDVGPTPMMMTTTTTRRPLSRAMLTPLVVMVIAVLGTVLMVTQPLVATVPSLADPPSPDAPLPQHIVWPAFYHLRGDAAVLSTGDTEQPTPEQVLRNFLDLHSSMNYTGSALLAQDLIDLVPHRPEGYYNLACAQARLRRHVAALQSLQQAVDRGWRNVDHMLADPDLATLYDDEQFQQIVETMHELRLAERTASTPLHVTAVDGEHDWRDLGRQLEAQIPTILERYDVPGVAIAIVDRGELVWTSSIGLADQASETGLTDQHVFPVRATVFLLAAIAATAEHEAGNLDLPQLFDAIVRDFEQRRQRERVAHRSAENPPAIPMRRDRSPNGRVRLLSHGSPSGPNLVILPSRGNEDHNAWPIIEPSAASSMALEWFTLAVEVAGRCSFRLYCRENFFDELGMSRTDFVQPPRPQRRHDAGQRRADKDGDGDINDEHDGSPVVIGHSRLGSPLQRLRPAAGPIPTAMHSTASDLGKLLAAIVASEEDAPAKRTNGDRDGEQAEPRSRLLSHNAPTSLLRSINTLFSDGAALPVQIDRTPAGQRVQIAETIQGTGCLIRWYPDAGCGIVVLFNSENGPEAALHIAHLGLGGP